MMALKSKPQGGTPGWVKRHPVATYFVLAYTITWLAWLLDILGYRGNLSQVLMMIAQFGLALAALIMASYSGALGRWARSIIR